MSEQVTINIVFNPEKVRAVRGVDSLSQFAEKTGIKLDLLSKIERGKRRPSIETLIRLCSRTSKFPNDFFDISLNT